MRELGLICLFGLTALDDMRTKEVRMLEIIAFGLIGIIINLVSPIYSLTSIIGGTLIGGLIYIYSVVSKEKIGKGDALIIIVVGLYLGYMNTMILIWLSSMFALISGIIVIKQRKVTGDYEMPFVPFMFLGYLSMYSIQLVGRILL